MSLLIKYNGKTIATLEKGQTATIPCDGKKMATDLVVSISAAVNLITFTIDGTTYQAEEGMTWGEWCDSAYNTGGFAANIYVAKEVGSEQILTDKANGSGNYIVSTNVIVDGHNYGFTLVGN